MGEDLAEIAEDFRLYCLSYWSEFYFLYVKWFNASATTESTRRAWMTFARQCSIVQLAIVSLSAFLTLLLVVRLYTRATTRHCTSAARMEGRTALVTGANTGIGLETARDLASRGARVILGCRNMSKGIAACKDIVATTGNENLVVRRLDLSCMKTVRDFASDVLESEERLDVIVLNAGVALTKRYMTEDNLELHMASNHFGHFLLANLMAPLIVKSAAGQSEPGRIVAVSSVGHWWGKIELDNLNSERHYDAKRIYGTTKLANILMAKELARRLKSHNVVCNAVHPGSVQTDLFRNIPFLGLIQAGPIMGTLFKSAKEGAQTSIHAAVSEEASRVTGEYFVECRPHESSPDSRNAKLAADLWRRSVEILEMKVEGLMNGWSDFDTCEL